MVSVLACIYGSSVEGNTSAETGLDVWVLQHAGHSRVSVSERARITRGSEGRRAVKLMSNRRWGPFSRPGLGLGSPPFRSTLRKIGDVDVDVDGERVASARGHPQAAASRKGIR